MPASSLAHRGEVIERKALVAIARRLERMFTQRRALTAKLRDLDDRIRLDRQLLRDLTTPPPSEAYVCTASDTVLTEPES